MASQSKRPSPVSSREVRALLRRADKLFAEGAKLQVLARQALIKHYRDEVANQPTADDRLRRQKMARKIRKK